MVQKIEKIVSLDLLDIKRLKNEVLLLQNLATQTIENSYSPYSKFKVVAAFLLNDGSSFAFTNQENASYPSGLCAERVGLFSLGSQFPNKRIDYIYLKAQSTVFKIPEILCPCAACLQVMAETQMRQEKSFEIIMEGKTNIYSAKNLHQLLPFSFDLITNNQ